MRPVAINAAEFEQEVLQAEELTLVHFEIPWSRACRKIVTPILEVITDRYDWETKVVKINVEKNGKIAEDFGIKNIPTVLFFAGGKVVDRLHGFISLENVDARIQRLLSIPA